MESLLSILRAPHVHVGDECNVVAKVKAMAIDGCDKLQVVSDFAMTLTRYLVNGKRGFTSYGVLENGSHMPAEYRQKALEVYQKYAPVEVSDHMSMEEKLRGMEEWWEASHNLLVKYKLTKVLIEAMVAEANVDFRHGCDAMLSVLEEKRIPLTIFSSGLVDIITAALRRHSLMKGNICIISNQTFYNNEGFACGFSQPVIHSLNKGKSTAQLPSNVKEEAKRRGNIILIGDSLVDPKMDSGLPLVKEVLKIGFLNHNVEELLPVYLELYDIVVTEDGSLDAALAVLTAVIGREISSNEDYKQRFSPNVYLSSYYTNIDAVHHQPTLEGLHELFSSGQFGGKILEIGCGPVIAWQISAAPHASEIVLADLVESNRDAIHLWLNKDARAHDWTPFFRYIVQTLEGKGEEEIPKREEQLRQVVKAVIPSDITKDPPVSLTNEGPYDIIMDMAAVCTVAKNEADYVAIWIRLAKLLMPGGVIISRTYIAEDLPVSTYSYPVGEEEFFEIVSTEEMLRKSLKTAGFSIVKVKQSTSFDSTDPCIQQGATFSGTVFVIAKQAEE